MFQEEVIYDSDSVQPRHSKVHGLGVFAQQDFRKFQAIEVAPVIYVPNRISERASLFISDYSYATGNTGPDGCEEVAVLLGYASLYNHSEEPSADFDLSVRDTVIVVAMRDIQKGEEITINYGTGYWDSRADEGIYPC